MVLPTDYNLIHSDAIQHAVPVQLRIDSITHLKQLVLPDVSSTSIPLHLDRSIVLIGEMSYNLMFDLSKTKITRENNY